MKMLFSEKEMILVKNYFGEIQEVIKSFGGTEIEFPEMGNEIEIPEGDVIKNLKVSMTIVKFIKKVSPEILETIKEVKEIMEE